ncbi:hypothetical protein BC937DRAFT_92254 [Endogone sp. FLAS-F59071]|nr:hypothetical protein BC937DRAFT_92254 [Endogone sp. FLAS-F59071]|eukprot:RUS15594.1 hypothetical protein BC937DRAFT_92254 [Endogone sp. FLAS-F59071]
MIIWRNWPSPRSPLLVMSLSWMNASKRCSIAKHQSIF